MICDRWDVVVVPFPFVDAPASKARPALALSPRAFNAANGHTVLAMITRAAATRWQSDRQLGAWQAAGLNSDCFVRWKIFTLDNRVVARRLGALAPGDRRACAADCAAILG